ncbi:MAG: hypothetical protein FJ403_14480 [Verrucomicrobia bacterium]|nr:hypothetical protein [Verrucomicrobiota bacterium]
MGKWLALLKSRMLERATWSTFLTMISARCREDQIKARLHRLALHPVSRAFALSLAFHGLVFGAIEAGYRIGWWDQTLFSTAAKTTKLNQQLSDQQKDQSSATREIPIVFIEVDPALAATKPPEQTKYYSSHSSRAANREAQKDADIPKITGTQDKVPKTLEHARSEPMPLQPAPPVEQPARESEQPSRPKSAAEPGETVSAKPSDDAKINKEPSRWATEQPPPQRRPRRLDELKIAQATSPGEKMKQDGGVRRYTVEGLDVKATPFGSYDAKVVEAIRQCWYDMLDGRDFVRNESGKVVLTFRLNSDGSVSRLNVAESDVSMILSIICQRAVREPAPFGPWPNDMRRLIGADYREVRFTFHYN